MTQARLLLVSLALLLGACSTLTPPAPEAAAPTDLMANAAGSGSFKFKQVSAGRYHTCGVTTSGSVTCWGYDGDGRVDAPTGTFSQVSAGYSHTCGVTQGGSVACWGNNGDGQATPPTPTVSSYTLDFTTAPVGMTWNVGVGKGISGPTRPGRVSVMGLRRGSRGNTARVVGGEGLTPQELGGEDKVLIVAPNKRAAKPDRGGGLLDLNFARFGRRVTVASLELSGVTTPGGRVELWGGGKKLSNVTIPTGTNTPTLETAGVARMRIFLTGPGAVDDVVVVP